MIEALHGQAVRAALGEKDAAGNQRTLSPEEVQLYYQIALIGYRDLSITPDPRSGFEMTLLRMLAFAPNADSAIPVAGGSPADEGVRVKAPSAGKTATIDRKAIDRKATDTKADDAKAVGSKAADRKTTDKAVEASESASRIAKKKTGAKTNKTAKKGSDQQDELTPIWLDVLDRSEIGGVTRMIAENSVLIHYALPQLELLLDEGHDTLLNDGQLKNLNRALSKTLECEVKLSIETGAPASETPARTRVREAQERQAHAEQVIQQDVVVQGLLDEFGGQIEQVRPTS
jgi:DNA polymerase-3 subunit gamma/tau